MAGDIENLVGPRPIARLAQARAYVPPAEDARIVLRLDRNEGPAVGGDILACLQHTGADTLRRYPSTQDLESALGDAYGVDASRVVATNGADEAIDRVCRAFLEPGRDLLTHAPGFEMIPRAARLCGAGVREVAWVEGEFDARAMIDGIDAGVGVVAVVSPNNPTGCVVGGAALCELARAANRVGAVLLADLAYAEFADTDPMPALLEHANVVVVRTFSKAHGLAGARVGYALASPMVAAWLRAIGGPYPIPGVSLRMAQEALRQGCASAVRTIVLQREGLAQWLAARGVRVLPSQANFVLGWFDDAQGVWVRLREAGVAVRLFEGVHALEGALRITLPGDASGYELLLRALEYALGRGPCPTPLGEARSRSASLERRTNETRVRCTVRLDGVGDCDARTGLGFLDHMLHALARHSGMDVGLACEGDLHVDDHHSVEDCAIVLGRTIDQALGERRGIARFGEATVPMDEALCRAVVDLSGRPSSSIALGLLRERVGGVATENMTHFLQTLAVALRASVHVDVLRGENDHHKAEAAFKALALALGRAVRIVREGGAAPSTKGVL